MSCLHRSSVRLVPLLASLLTLVSLLLAPPAWAGYYLQTSQTGGLLTYKDATFPTLYSATPYGYGAMGNSSEWADCSGQITTFFEWQSAGSGDDPPKQVIIRESCSASWVGYGVSSPAFGVADNALGFPEVPNGPVPIYDGSGNLQYWEGGGDAGGTRYRIEAGKQTVKVTCSPRASTDGGSGGYAEVSLFYSADVYPVVVTLTGTTPDQKNILIGQGCTATMTAGPATLSNYQWSVPGLTFAAFDVDPSHVPPHWGNPRYVFDEYTKPNPHWYWRKDENVTVSGTAEATIDGQSLGTVTAERTVTISAPGYSFDIDIGQVRILTGGGAGTIKATSSAYSSRGITWRGRVLTPSLFSGNGAGLWHFIQLIVPGRSKWLVNGGSIFCSENGNEGLDTCYPYDPYEVPYFGGLGGWIADNTEQESGDSPNTDLWDDVLRVNIDESFETYVMYHPPGDSQWVPLYKIQWRWYADATRPSTSWGFWPAGQQAGYVARSSNQRWYEHPLWSRLEGVFIGSGW